MSQNLSSAAVVIGALRVNFEKKIPSMSHFSVNAHFIPYHSFSKIGKNMGTLGKLSTYEKKMGTFN